MSEHDDGHVNESVRLAQSAAETVRALNHAGVDGGAWQWPSQVYDTIGALASLAQRLPQTLDQMADWLVWAHMSGRVGHDQRASVRETVAATVAGLDDAAAALADLRAALDRAHQHTSHLTGIAPAAPAATTAAEPWAGETR